VFTEAVAEGATEYDDTSTEVGDSATTGNPVTGIDMSNAARRDDKTKVNSFPN
jgi:hypothetical protein